MRDSGLDGGRRERSGERRQIALALSGLNHHPNCGFTTMPIPYHILRRLTLNTAGLAGMGTQRVPMRFAWRVGRATLADRGRRVTVPTALTELGGVTREGTVRPLACSSGGQGAWRICV